MAGEDAGRDAHFVCALSLAWPDGDVQSFEARSTAHWLATARRQGFGYDPMFVATGMDQTFGEIDPATSTPSATAPKPSNCWRRRSAMTDLALYVHWPFCVSKCPYCDFNSHVRDTVDQDAWRHALLTDLAHEAALLPDRRLTSIFFGGGTPR